MARHNQTGQQGEQLAAEMLRSKGYEILHTNWRSNHYELDIIAKNAEELVIVEVKTRSSINYEMPEMAVDQRKIRRIVYAADHYIKMFCIDLPVRFDIVSVLMLDSGTQIEHIPDAFYPPVLS
ncbi:MAG: YraN family protein [Bacteroidales bacterium]